MSRGSDPSQRRPRWVYREGEEPDYRFSFANERTYLAWLRTALSLIAAGVAVDVVIADDRLRVRLLAVLLLSLGIAAAVLAVLRWMRAERAMRLREPLPGFSWFAVLPIGLVALSVAVWVLVL